jgi:hypothetical protein
MTAATKPWPANEQQLAPAPKCRFNLVQFDQIKFENQRRYLIKGLIPREGLTVIWGPPKCGKSFWAYDAMMHVALGREYRGRRVQQSPVVYIACEGMGGQGARAQALRLTHLETYEGKPPPFNLISTVLNLPTDHQQLIKDIKAQMGDTIPGAVVIDTLNRSIGGSENDPSDMSAFVAAADAIQRAFNCAVIIIHHCGVDATRPRGHTSLTGAADCQLAVRRGPDKIITVVVEWMKDGAEGAEIHSTLRVVDVGHDEDGDQETSCIVEPAEGPSAAEPNKTKLSPDQQTMLTILVEAGQGGLSVDEWNDRAKAIGLGIKRRQSLYDHRAALKRHKLIYEFPPDSGKWFVTTGTGTA